jgi:TRAP-type C4-dicarboxylate transport system permease large subunit
MIIAIGLLLAYWGGVLLADGWSVRMAGAPLPQGLYFLLLTVALMITGAVMARRRRYATEAFPGFRVVLSRLMAALPGVLLVGVIFGDIRAGVFTAIESASIAVVYAVAVTAVAYRKLTWQNFVEACTGAVRTTGLIVFVIGAAASFGWLLAYLQVPAGAVQVLTSVTHDQYLLLLLMILILLVILPIADPTNSTDPIGGVINPSPPFRIRIPHGRRGARAAQALESWVVWE